MVFTQIPKMVGFIYALVMIFVIAYLWYSGRWQQKSGWLILVISAALGFLIFSPVAPYQFQQLVLKDEQGLGAPLIVGAIGLFIVFLLTLASGRIFCGYLCPVGVVQEIAYHIPVPKTNPRQKNAFRAARWVFFVVFFLMAFVFSASLLGWFGIRDLPFTDRRHRNIYCRAGPVSDLVPAVLPPCLPVRSPVVTRCVEKRAQTAENRCLYRM